MGPIEPSDPFQRAYCATCTRPIYQMPAGKGQPSEWRHGSSAHPVSWTPERHIAGPTLVYEHQHKWVPINTEHNTSECEVSGCDARVLTYEWTPTTKKHLSERERREAESRRRGTLRSKQRA